MMKKTGLILAFGLVFTLLSAQTAGANMAAPRAADVGSSITFEQSDALSVGSERLEITVSGAEAHIVAAYKMKNTTGERISTEAMFLSPNMKSSGVKVTVSGKDVPFTAESYALNYSTEIKTEDWRYAVLTEENIASRDGEQTVDTITFEMNFAPNEAYDAVVSYTYRLGGYPEYEFNAKRGEIEYYLTPAALWKDFGGITIDLKLSEDMPVIASSNLDFKKIGPRTYRYASDTLPQENLEIVIDENWWQNIFSTLKSPYLPMLMVPLLPVLLIGLAVGIFLVRRLHRKKKG